MTSNPKSSDSQHDLLQKIDDLQIRTLYLEDTVDSLNNQLADLTQEFILAKQAMRLLHQRLEQMHNNQPTVKDFSEETPPPHY